MYEYSNSFSIFYLGVVTNDFCYLGDFWQR